MPQNSDLLLHYARIGVDDAIQRQQALLSELEAAKARLERTAKGAPNITIERTNGSNGNGNGLSGGVWTAARRAAVSRRMKAYWAGKRKA